MKWQGYGLLLVMLGMGCSTFGPGLAGTPCPVEWMPSDKIDETVASLHARMRIQVGDEVLHLELIAKARPGEQIVVALSQYGTRLFAIRQRGSDVTVEDASSHELEQVALWVMDALHRAYWIARPFDLEDDSNGDAGWWAGERVMDVREGDNRVRVFTLPDADPATQQVSIEYSGTNIGESAPRVTIGNPWCGYDAVIVPIQKP